MITVIAEREVGILDSNKRVKSVHLCTMLWFVTETEAAPLTNYTSLLQYNYDFFTHSP